MGIYRIRDFDPQAIAMSGQCFRMTQTAPGRVELVAFARHLVIDSLGGEQFEFSCSEKEFEAVWRPYFDLDSDYGVYREAVDGEDRYLLRAMEAGRGLRILRQDPWETLVSFILSQRKNIPAIRDAVEKLCRALGEPFSHNGRTFYAFPTPQALAGASPESCRSCAVGYRAPYIQAAARAVTEGEINLAALPELNDEALLEKLLSIHGVGIKVARCAMLFGFHRLSSAPVDVWIKRVIDTQYGGASPFQRYPGIAGIMQQYMFYDQMLQKRGQSPGA